MELIKTLIHGKKANVALANSPQHEGVPYFFDIVNDLGRVRICYRKHRNRVILRHIDLSYPDNWVPRDLNDLLVYPKYYSRDHIRSAVTRYMDPKGLNINLDGSVVYLSDFRTEDFVVLAKRFDPKDILDGSITHYGSLMIYGDTPDKQLTISSHCWAVTAY